MPNNNRLIITEIGATKFSKVVRKILKSPHEDARLGNWQPSRVLRPVAFSPEAVYYFCNIAKNEMNTNKRPTTPAGLLFCRATVLYHSFPIMLLARR